MIFGANLADLQEYAPTIAQCSGLVKVCENLMRKSPDPE